MVVQTHMDETDDKGKSDHFRKYMSDMRENHERMVALECFSLEYIYIELRGMMLIITLDGILKGSSGHLL